jgi:hypothetical protein|tara:strand:- start:1140 stop:2117 length:978 start_codon:yes stop_codon:yes gene_type:complete
MKTDKTVSGAANKILGLLQPEGQATQEPKAEPSTSPEVEQEVSNSSQPQSEETTQETPVVENEETNETASEVEVEKPDLHRVKVQGQELDVTLDELKAGYSRDSDYRQKTHSLSLDRKAFDDERNSLRQSYDQRVRDLNEAISSAESLIRQEQGGDNLKKLYEEDPARAAQVDYKIRQRQDELKKLRDKAEQVQTTQYNQYLSEQRKLAEQFIPEYADPNKSTNFKNNVKTTLSSYGFNDQEIGSLADYRFLMVLKDAMAYKDIKASKPVVQKKVVNAPKVIKSGVAKTENSKRQVVRNKIGKLRKSGHLKDAQSAILDMIQPKQ